MDDDKFKVLLVDKDPQLLRRLTEFLSDRGFAVKAETSVKSARSRLFEWHPKIVLSDLILSDGSGLDLLKLIQHESSLQHDFTTFMIMSAHSQRANVRQAIQSGVDDYIIKPFDLDDLLNKFVFHLQNFRQIPTINKKDYNQTDEASLFLHLTDLLLRQALKGLSLENTLFNLVQMVSLKTKGVRCNVVHCVEDEKGTIVTSNDDRNASGININLNRYPEILHVRNTGSIVVIENIDKNKNLRFIKQHLKSIQFNAIIVCPVYKNGEFFGVLSLRLPENHNFFTDNELRFIEICSHVISMVLSSQNYGENSNYWLKSA